MSSLVKGKTKRMVGDEVKKGSGKEEKDDEEKGGGRREGKEG